MRTEYWINGKEGRNELISFINSVRLRRTIRHSTFLAASGLLFVMFLSFSISVSASDIEINCDAHEGTCSQSMENQTVTLNIEPRPVKAMHDLVFKVSISGNPPSKSPYIDLGMPAMKMGPNRVFLEATAPGHYEGQGVIVRCKSGRRTWFANVVIPESGEVKFIFDVIY